MVNFEPSCRRRLKAFEEYDDSDHGENHQPPITGERVADGNQDLGGERQLNVHALKDGEEFRQHVRHENDHDDHAHASHHGGINQGRGELGLHFGEALKMVGHPAQHLHERAALLTRPDHVDVQIRKDHRLLGHGIGETFALHDLLLQLLADFGRNTLGFQMSHAVERDRQRHPGMKQIGELLREGRQLLELRFALALQNGAQRRRQQALQIAAFALGPLGCRRSRDAGLGGIHHKGEKPEAFDLDQGRGAIGDFQHSLDGFTGATAGFIGKLRHKR